MSNRAARRAAGPRRRVVPCDLVVFEIDVAIGLNSENPVPGMAPILYQIRAQFGPEASVGFCAHCQDISVLI